MSLEQHEECACERSAASTGESEAAEKLSHASPTHTYLQRFTVAYEYPVAFTRDLFAPANRVLVETLTRLEPNRRHKVAVFIPWAVA
jgi:3-dehydroquinate synthase